MASVRSPPAVAVMLNGSDENDLLKEDLKEVEQDWLIVKQSCVGKRRSE
jgi:hypothetical protein